MKKICITGAEGFIGSHLTELSVKSGYQVVAMSLYNSFGLRGWLDTLDPKVLKEVEIQSGDIRDRGSVESLLKGCDAVLNLAALIAIPYSYKAPESYIDTNIKGTLNILEASRRLGIEKIIQISTSEVYGTASYVPIDEKHPLNAQSPYAASKIAADQLCLSYHRSFGTPVSIARPFNTYGPRQSKRAVIPTIISQIANGEREIKLGSLQPTRDFNYVYDTISGILSVLKADKSIGEVINIGSNYEISIRESVNLIADLMGKQVNVIEDQQRIRPDASEVERLWADNKKAKDLLGWTPKFSGLEGLKNGFSLTIDWFKDPQNLKNYQSSSYEI